MEVRVKSKVAVSLVALGLSLSPLANFEGLTQPPKTC